jgi:hypothetical protein
MGLVARSLLNFVEVAPVSVDRIVRRHTFSAIRYARVTITPCRAHETLPSGRPPAFNPFTCPNCNALYQVVKVEAGPETDSAK